MVSTGEIARYSLPHATAGRVAAGGGTKRTVSRNKSSTKLPGVQYPGHTAGPTHSEQLRCRSLLVRSEHGAKRGQNHIEAGVVIRERLGIALLQIKLELRARVADIRRLLAEGTPQARRVLEVEAFDDGERRGYRFTGQGTYAAILPVSLTTPNMVTPAGGDAGLTATS